VYFGKVVSLVCFMMVIRWTLPRLRYDQVMMLGWGALIPISLAVVVMTSVMVYLGDNAPIVGDATAWPVMLAANAVLFGVILIIMPLLPRSTRNRKIQLYGSRFNPVPGFEVSTAPTDPTALEDRPVEGTAPTV